MKRHWHLRRWTWKPWSMPTEMFEEIVSDGRWYVERSRICSRCDYVNVRMLRRIQHPEGT